MVILDPSPGKLTGQKKKMITGDGVKKDEKISDVFEQINNGSFHPERQQRRCRVDLDPYDRIVECPSSITDSDEDDNEDSYRQDDSMESSVAQPTPTRGDGVMRTTEALDRLTKYKEDDLVEEDEWIIIRVPKKVKKDYFLVDYCDGDEWDEYEWLEGPHLQSTVTVEDLLERERSMPRKKNAENKGTRNIEGMTMIQNLPALTEKRNLCQGVSQSLVSLQRTLFGTQT